MTTSRSDRAVVAMAAVRATLGAAAYLAPDRTARSMGLDPGLNPQMRYLGRVFGARDVALGAALIASDGEARELLLRTCIAIEALDAVSAIVAHRTGTIDGRAAGALLGAVVAAAVPEAVALAARR